MSRPSEPLLQWLRKILEQKGLNTASVATAIGLPRARVRRILSGKETMTVDELLQLSDALELSPADMGVPVEHLEEAAKEKPSGGGAEDDDDFDDDDFEPVVNPWLNHHRQLFQIAFALGCEFAFVLRTGELVNSGIPDQVIDAHQGGDMLIRLDAAYHQYNNPRYDSEGVTIALSFDGIYDCTFPWSAIQRVVFEPVPPEDLEADEEPPTPHLRLVT